MGAGSEKRAYAAIEMLHTENPRITGGAIVYLPLKLSDLADVSKAVCAVLMVRQDTGGAIMCRVSVAGQKATAPKMLSR